MLMKALVAEQEVVGPARELLDIRARQAAALSKKTLGHVVGVLTGNLLTPAMPVLDAARDDDVPTKLTEPWFRTTFSIEMSAERHEKVSADLTALVDLRNELVHHFLEKQDIWSENGCRADAYLDACYKQIDERYEELRLWANTALDARHTLASFMRTPDFAEFLLHGIFPGGAGVAWESSTIVELLRKAEASLAREGWTPLNDAIALIQAENPEHTPRRYGCRSWRQVLHESRQFLVRKERTEPGQATSVWYQCRTSLNRG